MKTLFATAMLTLGAAFAPLAAAQSTRPAFADLDDARVEHAFWQCDVQSMQVVLEPGEGILCERLTDALKQRRFGGDFKRFLAWWQERKAIEHARRGDAPGMEPEVP